MGDINEYEVIQFVVGDPVDGFPHQLPYFHDYMERLRYEPSNGAFSDRDLYRLIS